MRLTRIESRDRAHWGERLGYGERRQQVEPFGLDLARSGKWLALGFHQLMYDHGAWLLRRFDPSIRVTRGGEALWYRADAPLGKGIAADEQTPFSAVALSADAVLLGRFIFLPLRRRI